MHNALYSCLCRASEDTECNSNDGSMFEGLATKLSSDDFIKNMHLMPDALEVLKDSSESLQSRDITLSHAVNMIKRRIDVFLARQHNPGPHYSLLKLLNMEAFKAFSPRNFTH